MNKKSKMLNNKLIDPMEIIVNHTDALIYVIDLKTYEILYANKKCIKEFGQVIGKVCYTTLQINEDSPCSFCPLACTDDSSQFPIDKTFEWENKNSKNGCYYSFRAHTALWSDNKEVIINIGVDITEPKKLEKALLEEKNRAIASFKTLLDATIEAILIFDENKKCVLVNKVAIELFGYAKEEMIGKFALEFVDSSSHDLVKNYIQLDDKEPYEANMLKKNGVSFPAMIRGHNLLLAGKKVRVSAIMDITDRKKYEEKILKLAYYDILTGLPNRLLLKKYIQTSLQRSHRNNEYNALMFIDLDNFKGVNDTIGHDVGDLVLVEAALRIKNAIRENDIAARLGGDEFVVLLDISKKDRDAAMDSVRIIAQKILESLEAPYMIKNYDFRITASIGIKLFNAENLSMDELMKYADSAMYNAKEEGRNTFCFFNPELQKIMEDKIFLIDNLRRAIDSSDISLFYQPQVTSGKNKIVGVEALIRWNSSNGIISPADFIPLAEESGLIIKLGEWILNEAIKQIQLWERDSEKRDWRISINVSPKQFEDKTFMPTIEAILLKYNVKASKIRLELTEGILIQNINETLKKLNKLKKMGLSLSIDDFGTGYSSLSYLKQLPMDELKIDQSFIRDIMEDENDEIITQTIISIGQKFGLEVIAEGVETKEQYEKLISMGCKYFQGYLFFKPMSVEHL